MNTSIKSCLIEASAGTGKTYNIQNLFFKYIAIDGIKVEQIVVVTFTKAATAELSDRIRRILKEGYEYLHTGVSTEQERIEMLLESCDLDLAKNRLLLALSSFDQACISTIHGFCQAIIQEYAFECQMLMNYTLVENMDETISLLSRDFYRKHVYGKSQWEPYFLQNKITVNSIESSVKVLIKKQNCLIYSALGTFIDLKNDPIIDIESYRRSPLFSCAFNIYAAQWVIHAFEQYKEDEKILSFDDLLKIVHTKLVNNKSIILYEALQKRYKIMIVDEFQDTDKIQYEIFEALHNEEHPLILVGDPKQAIYSFRGGDLETYMRAKKSMILKQEKNKAQIMTLDHNYRSDPHLIKDINQIFMGHQSPFAYPYKTMGNLSFSMNFSEIKSDTESKILPVDYNPLKKIFIKEKVMLTKNDLFQKTIKACAQKINEILCDKSILIPKKMKDGTEKMCLVEPSDFAVLIFSNDEGQKMLKALKSYHIPAVISKNGNVFDTPEAKVLVNCLQAILDPSSTQKIFNAILSSFFKETITSISRMRQSLGDESLFTYQTLFLELKQIWIDHSFIKMIEYFLDVYNIRINLASTDNGARALTNLNQLIDVLHQENSLKKHSPAQLLEFLSIQMDVSTRTDKDEYNLLLETDDQAVKIVTIHSSKGLEYPFVMLPGLFTDCVNGHKVQEYDYYSDAKKIHVLRDKLDKKTEESAKNNALINYFQERLRLCYVALTRAKYKTYIYWGSCKDGSNVLVWLFGLKNTPQLNFDDLNFNPSSILDALKQKIDNNFFSNNLKDWEIYEEDYHVKKYRNSVDNEKLIFNEWDSEDMLEHRWKMMSFTHLAPHSFVNSISMLDKVVDDEYERIEPLEMKTHSIFDIESGNVTGNAWHNVFEKIDFTQPLDRNMIKSILEKNGLNCTPENQYTDLTIQMIENTLNKNLNGQSLQLSLIPMQHRMIEWEFYFPICTDFSFEKLMHILGDYALEYGVDPESWTQHHLEFNSGYFKGFIDLIFLYDGKFYILDWKSNSLDKNSEKFAPNALKMAMGTNYYFLQYLIYTVALMKYLSARTQLDWPTLYEQYYGGVYYLFLRGITAQDDQNGVYSVRPPLDLLLKLKELLS